jgi:hypothetical protein
MHRKTIAATILTTGLTLVAAPAAFAWDLTATVATSCTGTSVNVNAAASRPHAADFTVRTMIDQREVSVVRVRYTPSNNVFTIPTHRSRWRRSRITQGVRMCGIRSRVR